MSDFSGIVYLTEEQYLELKTTGTLTVGETTLTFDESTLYVTDDNTHERLTVVETDLSNAKPSIDFAENERQKSKNLWGSELQKGAYVFNDGNFTYDDNYATCKTLINVEPNKTITISWKGTPSTSDYGFVFFKDGVYVTGGGGQTTATVPSNANQVAFNFYAPDIGNNLNNIYDIQLEYGEVATEYQAYNGDITHNGDAPVVFAESERQKSKNLLRLKNLTYTINGVTASFNEEQQTITFNGTCTGNMDMLNHIRNIYPTIKNMAGKTFAISYKYIDGTLSGDNFSLYMGSLDENIYDNRFWIKLADDNVDGFVRNVTLGANLTYDTIFAYIPINTSFNNYTFKIQIEEGTASTDWQYPYGKIVHENQIADVEHIETIYDMDDDYHSIINGTAYRNGLMADVGVTAYQLGILKSKYKEIIVDGILDSVHTSTRLKVLGTDAQQGCLITGNISNNRYGISTLSFRIYSNGELSVIFANHMVGDSQADKNNNGGFIISKIRGVLK